MVSTKRCIVLLAPTKKATEIMEDVKGRLNCSLSPNLPKKGHTNYYMYIVYGTQVVASNDPNDNIANIPLELLKFYCRVNGIDSIMVDFYPEPKIHKVDKLGVPWVEAIYKPILNQHGEIYFKLPRRFKVNYIRRK